jgi:hypothetical protein
LIEALINGHTDIAEILLQDPRVDPSDHNDRAIKLVCEKGLTDILKLLLDFPKVRVRS